jgi:hypothetical protein
VGTENKIQYNQKLFLHLLISILLIPGFLIGNPTFKAVLLLYPISLVLKRDAVYIPALTILASYMSNSYVIYLTIIVLCIINYKKIQGKARALFITLLLFLPVTLYISFSKIFYEQIKIGLVLNQFQLYYSLFAFFYGILVVDTFNKLVLKGLFISLLILYIFNYFLASYSELATIRIIFFVIPLFFVLIIYTIFFQRPFISIVSLPLAIGLLMFSFKFTELTFTLLLSAILSVLFIILYLKQMNSTLVKIVGPFGYSILFLVFIIAIKNYDTYNSRNIVSMSRQDGGKMAAIKERFEKKLFEDRGALWSSVVHESRNNLSFLPPPVINEIQISTRKGSLIPFEYHSHDVYLELIRTDGLIMGSCFGLVFILMNLISSKLFTVKNINPYFVMLLSVSIGNNMIGGMSGTYVLLTSYAILGMSIPGIAYGLLEQHFNVTMSH